MLKRERVYNSNNLDVNSEAISNADSLMDIRPKKSRIEKALFTIVIYTIMGCFLMGILSSPISQKETSVTTAQLQPHMLAKSYGTVSSVKYIQESLSDVSLNPGDYFGRHYIALTGSDTLYVLPKYISIFIPKKYWLSANTIEIIYYTDSYNSLGGVVYYHAVGIKLNGLTLITPETYNALEKTWVRVLIILLLFALCHMLFYAKNKYLIYYGI